MDIYCCNVHFKWITKKSLENRVKIWYHNLKRQKFALNFDR